VNRKREIKSPEERRGELIKAARELFIEQGYEQTTMSSIAGRANVAQGTSYIYFRSKQDLLIAIMRDLLEALSDRIRRLADRTDLPAPAVLRQAMDDCLTLVGAEPRLVEALYLKANFSLPSQLLEQFAPMLLPIITGIIERGVDEGSLKVTCPRIAADFLWTVGYRLFEMEAQYQITRAKGAAVNPDDPTTSELQKAFWEFAAQGIGVSHVQSK
jgi:AcrR family transcriptional regulator